MSSLRRITGLCYGLIAYVAFGALFAYLIAFLNDVGIAKTINDGGTHEYGRWSAAGIDIGLIALFGLQHTAMARRSFKQQWTRVVPPLLERSTYVVASVVALAAVVLLWQPIGVDIWQVRSEPARVTLIALSGTGWLLVIAATFSIDHAELFGLRQSWAYYNNADVADSAMVTPLLYRVVRHPMQLGVIVALWVTPRLTVGRCVFAATMTAYTVIGLVFEERDLMRRFGAEYEAYRDRVPMLVPIRWRRVR